MGDITYCVNSQCPFKDCERHLSKVSEACIQGRGYVSVASFDGVCRRYISHLVDEIERTPKERGGEK